MGCSWTNARGWLRTGTLKWGWTGRCLGGAYGAGAVPVPPQGAEKGTQED